MMNTWIDTVVEPVTAAAPVDDLLRVYLGQTAGSCVPAEAGRLWTADAQDLWDRLGDFA
jgi:predicted RNase H-like nuclease